MTTITRVHHRQWGDIPEADTRVSTAEQQDHMPPVGPPGFWMVAALGLSPLLVICAGALVAFFYR